LFLSFLLYLYMREIIGEKTEFNKIFNYFLKLLDIVGPPAHTQYVVFST